MEDEKIKILSPEEDEELRAHGKEVLQRKLTEARETNDNKPPLLNRNPERSETPISEDLVEEIEEEDSDEEISIESIIRAENEEIEDEEEDSEINDIDIVKAEKSLKDYDAEDAEEILSKAKGIKDIIKTAKDYAGKGGGRKKVLDRVKEMNLDKRL